MADEEKKVVKKKIKLKLVKQKSERPEEERAEKVAKIETSHLKKVSDKVNKELMARESKVGERKKETAKKSRTFEGKVSGVKSNRKVLFKEGKAVKVKPLEIPQPDKAQQWREKQQKISIEKEKQIYTIREKSESREEDTLLSKVEEEIKKKKKKGEAVVPPEIEIQEVVTVGDLARKMNLKASEVIQKLLELGVNATINDNLDADTATIVASEFNCKVNVKSLKDEVEIKEEPDRPEDLTPRPPVVTIMGHVDHGKTKLLDAIRNSSIADHETGGITQHIGAYKVRIPQGEITFIDTPGHEAFTSLRARGANVTDIVVLVVSAVEGVMPQTIEAINHAKAANVPIIVAVNKIDLPDANPDRVRQQLAEQGLLCEEWGGHTLFVNVSALKKQGIKELLEAILLQAEIMELKANPNKRGWGYVIESKMDIGKGAVATVIVKNGCIKVGDFFVVGTIYGKVRGMFDDSGNKINIAYPSYPVEIMGFDTVPSAGDKFYVVESEEIAKNITQKRQELKRIEKVKSIKRLQLETAEMALSGKEVKEIKLIIKGDVQGSIEAIKTSLEKLHTEDVLISVIHSGVGAVLESDVMLASATIHTSESKVIIIAFRVRVDPIAREKAENEGIEIKRFNIIYELIDFIDGLVKGLKKEEYVEQVCGSAEIKEIFKIKDVGKVAGCVVKSGFIKKTEMVRIFRDGAMIWEGKIKSLKRFQEDVNEVQEGFECGISFLNFNNFKKGDIIECFSRELKA